MKEDIEGAIERLSKANSDIWYATLYSQEEQDKDIEILIKGYKELEKKNEEWQRAYQEEKDKQFELLRENKQLEKDNEQLEAIKNEAIRRYNFETIPKSKAQELLKKYELYKKETNITLLRTSFESKIEVIQELLES